MSDADANDAAASKVGTYAMLLAGMACFGSATPISKVVGEAFPAMVGSGLRVCSAAVVLLPILLWKRRELKELDGKAWWGVAGIAAFGMAGFTLFLLYGMKYVTGVVGSVIMSTAPGITAIGAALFLGNKMGWLKWLAVALVVGGVVLVNVAGDGGGKQQGLGLLVLGGGLVLAAVVCEACYTLMGKAVMRKTGPLVTAALAVIAAVPIFLVAMAIQWGSFDPGRPTLRQWAALAWWGLGTLALGSLLWYGGVSRVKGSVASAFMGVMPISALVVSYVVLGEAFHWLHAVGFAIVVAAILLMAWADERQSDTGDGS